MFEFTCILFYFKFFLQKPELARGDKNIMPQRPPQKKDIIKSLCYYVHNVLMYIYAKFNVF